MGRQKSVESVAPSGAWEFGREEPTAHAVGYVLALLRGFGVRRQGVALQGYLYDFNLFPLYPRVGFKVRSGVDESFSRHQDARPLVGHKQIKVVRNAVPENWTGRFPISPRVILTPMASFAEGYTLRQDKVRGCRSEQFNKGMSGRLVRLFLREQLKIHIRAAHPASRSFDGWVSPELDSSALQRLGDIAPCDQTIPIALRQLKWVFNIEPQLSEGGARWNEVNIRPFLSHLPQKIVIPLPE